jgi:preprotein translocase subunit SecY
MMSELSRRVWFTLGALFVYRLGTFIPVPGIDPAALASFFHLPYFGVGETFGANRGVHRIAIFALGITPYLTAAIIVQLATIASSRLRSLRDRGEAGRRSIVGFTLCLTVALAAFQAFGVALALESIPNFLVEPGWLFRTSAVASLVGGTMFLVWLSEQITARGIGNGLVVLLIVAVALDVPAGLAEILEFGRQGYLSSNQIAALLVTPIAVTAFVAFMEGARRRLPVDYGARQIGERVIEARSYLSLKLNGAGIIPPLVAAWVLSLVVTFSKYDARFDAPWWRDVVEQLGHGRPLFIVLYAVAIVLFAFFYTAFVLDPDQTAMALKKHGGTIADVEPGDATAEYIDRVLTRTSMIGAAYLVAVCLLPELAIAYAGMPFYFGGASLLMMVCAVIDFDYQVRGTMGV